MGWVEPRRGVEACLERLSSQPGNIAYFGNSVTAQRNGFKERLHRRLCDHLGQRHELIPAGIGGIGSMGCAFMARDMVIDRGPDLCFIDCSIADAGHATPRSQVGRSIEGIIRQFAAVDVPVCLLHLPRHCRSVQEQQHMEDVISIYERVADHDGVPSINLHSRYMEQSLSGQLDLSDLLYDGVHTSEAGSERVSMDLFDGFIELQARKSVGLGYKVPGTLFSDPFEHASILPADRMLVGVPTGPIKRFRFSVPYLTIEPGGCLEFISSKPLIYGIMVVADASSGVVEIRSLKDEVRVQLFDEWCAIPRLQMVILQDPLKPDEPFTICCSQESTASRNPNGTSTSVEKMAADLKLIGFMAHHDQPPASHSPFIEPMPVGKRSGTWI